MTTTEYQVPDSPADPEAAALELLVRLPVEILDGGHLLREVLQDFAGELHAEGAFAGLSWPDAKAIAAAIAFDVTGRDDPEAFIRHRARNALSGVDNMGWIDREAAARAMNIAATLLGL